MFSDKSLFYARYNKILAFINKLSYKKRVVINGRLVCRKGRSSIQFFEILTWSRLNIHDKPCGLLNTSGFYDKMIEFIDYATEQQFIPAAHRALMRVADAPEALLLHMQLLPVQQADALKKA